jgi:hypothetical protein
MAVNIIVYELRVKSNGWTALNYELGMAYLFVKRRQISGMSVLTLEPGTLVDRTTLRVLVIYTYICT